MIIDQINLIMNAQHPLWWDYFFPIISMGIILLIILIPTIIFIRIIRKEAINRESKLLHSKITLSIGIAVITLDYLFQMIVNLLLYIGFETVITLTEFDFLTIWQQYSKYCLIQLGILIIFSIIGFSCFISNISEKNKQKKYILNFIPLTLYFVFEFIARLDYIRFPTIPFDSLTTTNFLAMVSLFTFALLFIYTINSQNIKKQKRIILPIILALFYIFSWLFVLNYFKIPDYNYWRWIYLFEILYLCNIMVLLIYIIIQINLIKMMQPNNLPMENVPERNSFKITQSKITK
ncbi:MAG TPA: hypothetical protein VMZ29_14315 [Candidatus Bathyarchaeia archaeon]|nr:hypothetical protein [Candidatus Bathyarchaeia archaeon]